MDSEGRTIDAVENAHATAMDDFPDEEVSVITRCPMPRFQGRGGRRGRRRPAPAGPLQSRRVRAAMRQAWRDSQPNDPANRHEEGGYIIQNADGSYAVERWPRGAGASIQPPPRAADGSYNGRSVVGEFHTHPNPNVDEAGRQWQEAPSLSDERGIRNEGYAGDSYVVGHDNVYRVDNTGNSNRAGARRDVLRR